jgi:ribosomal protein S18 acetylase RimI-like enzyme
MDIPIAGVTTGQVVPATVADLEQVARWVTSAEACLSWAGPRVSFPFKTSQLADEIMFSQDNSYCYRLNAGPAGFGQIIQITDDGYHLARVITIPGYRGQGIARELCVQLIDIAWHRGARQLSLNVYRNNIAALSLYQQLGFIEQIDRSDDTIMYMLSILKPPTAAPQ